MAAAGAAEPGGEPPNLSWIIAPVETFTPTGAYGLAVAGDAAGPVETGWAGREPTGQVPPVTAPLPALLRSTATLARELTTEPENLDFDREILAITEPLTGPDGKLELAVTGRVTWGHPMTRSSGRQ